MLQQQQSIPALALPNDPLVHAVYSAHIMSMSMAGQNATPNSIIVSLDCTSMETSVTMKFPALQHGVMGSPPSPGPSMMSTAAPEGQSTSPINNTTAPHNIGQCGSTSTSTSTPCSPTTPSPTIRRDGAMSDQAAHTVKPERAQPRDEDEEMGDEENNRQNEPQVRKSGASAANRGPAAAPVPTSSIDPTAPIRTPPVTQRPTTTPATPRPLQDHSARANVAVQNGARTACQANRDAALAQRIPKVEKLEDPTGKNLRIDIKTCKIHGLKTFTTRWYHTASMKLIERPRDGLRPSHTNLYVHEYVNEGKRCYRVWMWDEPPRDNRRSLLRATGMGAGAAEEKGRWMPIRRGFYHPELDGYVLNIHDDGRPAWVKEASARIYAKNRRARVIRG